MRTIDELIKDEKVLMFLGALIVKEPIPMQAPQYALAAEIVQVFKAELDKNKKQEK